MDIIRKAILSIHDPGINSTIELLPIGTVIENVSFDLSSGRTILSDQILKNGPLIIVFIRGTWCPFCRMHLARFRNWIEKNKKHKATLIVVSTENSEKIQQWLKRNPATYLFASDSNFILSDYFKVRIDPNDFSNAATFLIDQDHKVRLAYKGKRTGADFEAIKGNI